VKDYPNDTLSSGPVTIGSNPEIARLAWNPTAASLLGLADSSAVSYAAPEPYGVYRAAGKRLLDIVLVVISLPVTIPVMLICAAVLWLESGLPLYRQDRLGQGGARFSIWKLRTMVRDADRLLEIHLANDPALRAEWNATQKLKADPRITRFGAVLRATSLDELPQLWNVLRGDMSLVGPRPMLPEQLALYGNADAYFALRPGLTGPWQVSDRNENRFDYRAVVDAQYHRALSLGQDLRILVRTVGVVVQRTGY
jgi:lipopolysaccharide/colanic/teichoic acid biosynthesis glycosyltransferase